MPPLDDCKILLKKFHSLTVYYIFKEANQYIDVLTKFKIIIFFITYNGKLLAFDKLKLFFLNKFVNN